MRLARRSLAAAAGSVLSLALSILPHAGSVAEAAVSSSGGVRLNGYEAALVTDINNARGARGLGRLTVVPGATDVARRWAWHLANVQALSHNPSLVTNLEHAGSSAWTTLAENVGMAAATDPGELFTAYMNSAPHRANILDPSMRYLGVGVVQRGSTAWNTLDFVDAYSTGYGHTRVPTDGLTMDQFTPTTTTTLASLEGGVDQRFAATHSGTVASSLVHFSGPSTRNDLAYAYFRDRVIGIGHGDLYMRDAVSFSHLSSVSLQLAQYNAAGRSVAVQVLLSRGYVGSVSLGTVRVGARPAWFTLYVPSSARGFRDTLTLRVSSSTLSGLGSTRLGVYAIRVNA